MLDNSRDQPYPVNKAKTIYYEPMAMNPDPKFRQIRAFVTAMETTSFTLAAQRMEISQPSFSALIRDLESGLQAKLFERTTRRCVPTDAAQRFYEQVKSPLREIELAYRSARDLGNGVGGRLRLAALPSMASGAITRKLAEFQRAHPDVTITLIERRHDQQREAVLNGDVEFGICTLGGPHPELSFQSLYTDRLMIVVPARHPLVGSKPNWRALNDWPLILVSSGQAEDAMRVQGVSVIPACDVEQVSTALAMVRQGMGITVLSSSIIPDLAIEGLACLPIHGPKVFRSMGVIRRRHVRLSRIALAFVRTLRDLSPPQFEKE
ncbi:MAG TPA: LysR substrate-binding domain-containing protein [Bordetella sp.]|nr:LysR substrate-binding domain-containing protein [Bordetella sp.]